MTLDPAKLQQFVKDLETKSQAFLDTLDKLLTAAEGSALADYLKAHYPQAMTWEAELHAAVDFMQSAELKILPEIDAVLAFLATITTPKASA